ncbi:hypothetical protein Bbelb_190560 [Branchiostoma belcheri]|nr:hypothetical protein Bbelb_190560 [Branchiostoma belcheri]
MWFLKSRAAGFPATGLFCPRPAPIFIFRAILHLIWRRVGRRPCVLKGLDAAMFGEILSYIYSGTLHVSLDRVQHLYQAADCKQTCWGRTAPNCLASSYGTVLIRVCLPNVGWHIIIVFGYFLSFQDGAVQVLCLFTILLTHLMPDAENYA